jgi:hypothetical protein
MKLTDNGAVFDDYRSCSPSTNYCSFTDHEGATLLIPAATLVRMYNIVKYDLETRHGWLQVMDTVEEEQQGGRNDTSNR